MLSITCGELATIESQIEKYPYSSMYVVTSSGMSECHLQQLLFVDLMRHFMLFQLNFRADIYKVIQDTYILAVIVSHESMQKTVVAVYEPCISVIRYHSKEIHSLGNLLTN